MKAHAVASLVIALLIPVVVNGQTNSQCEMVYPGSTWKTADPASVGMEQSYINLFLRKVNSVGSGTDSIIIRNGYIVGATGYPGALGPWSSASKICYSILAMLLVHEGIIPSLDDSIGKYFSFGSMILNTIDKNITWRQLMNMESGYALNDKPGEKYAYNNLAIDLFVESLKRAYGVNNLNFIIDKYFSSLEFTGPIFNYYDRSSANLYDFAKLLYLMMNEGWWNGQIVIRSDIIKDAFSKTASMPISNGPCNAEGYLPLPGLIPGTNETKFSGFGPGEYVCNAWINKKGRMGMPVDLVQANGNWGRVVAFFSPSLRLMALTRINNYLPADFDMKLYSPYIGVISDNMHFLYQSITVPCPPVQRNRFNPGILYLLLLDE